MSTHEALDPFQDKTPVLQFQAFSISEANDYTNEATASETALW